ncbi:hypothetical protein LLY42_23340 [Pseudomonas frederiksbergensis]|nr:hypothetical protein LLY42_23340 [Pseudomonas frederiksbergensis]
MLILINNSHVKNSKRRTSGVEGLRGAQALFGTLTPKIGRKIKAKGAGVRY